MMGILWLILIILIVPIFTAGIPTLYLYAIYRLLHSIYRCFKAKPCLHDCAESLRQHKGDMIVFVVFVLLEYISFQIIDCDINIVTQVLLLATLFCIFADIALNVMSRHLSPKQSMLYIAVYLCTVAECFIIQVL